MNRQVKGERPKGSFKVFVAIEVFLLVLCIILAITTYNKKHPSNAHPKERATGIRLGVQTRETKNKSNTRSSASVAETEKNSLQGGVANTEKREGMYKVSDFQVSDIVPKEAVESLGSQVFFYQQEISDAIFERIKGKSFPEGCTTKREDLRYIRVLYRDFEGRVRVGELIGNQSVSEDFLYIFAQLYKNDYPIEKMRLVDDYDADDEKSAADNNTSCFNYRMSTGGTKLSYHSYGVAIDINPRYNPYMRIKNGDIVVLVPENSGEYVDRSRDFPHKIDENDLCYRLFKERGFSWGGTWVHSPDYMHFSKWKNPE